MPTYTKVTQRFDEINAHVSAVGEVLLKAKLELSENQYDFLHNKVETDLHMDPNAAIKRFKEQQNQ